MNKEIKKELFDYAKLHPNIVYITEAIGGFDFEIEVQIENIDKFYAFLDKMKNQFGKVICDINFFEYVKEHKLNYLPL